MRKLLLALALCASTATASTDPPAAGQPYQQFRTSDRYRRVAVIRPSRWDVLGGNVNAMRQDLFAHLGTTLDQMEMRGLEVHYYDTAFFESDKDHREMWTDLGAKYGLAIILPFWSSQASFARYICADSTNVQLLVLGGCSNADWATGAVDSTLRGQVDRANPTQLEARPDNGACLVTNDGIDTVWALRIASGRRCSNTRLSTMGSINQVVRLLRPVVVASSGQSATSWSSAGNVDSINTNMPGSVSGNPADSVAAQWEYLGPMWRVEYVNYSGEGDPTWINSLAAPGRTDTDGGASPRSVYFYKFPTQSTVARATPLWLWSLICRFTKASPIPYSYEWDDVTDKFGENGGTPPGLAISPPRWRQTAIDSAIRGLNAIGISPTMMVNAQHASVYFAGTGTPRYEGAMDGTPRTYLRNYAWVHHVHDSTADNVGGSLVGRAGGYSSGNGGAVTINGSQVETFSWRFASRFAPTATGSWAARASNFGIVQRLAYADSIRQRISPWPAPPYMAFPANRMLPVNWRARSISVSGWYPHYGPITGSVDSLCPIDSTLWALDTMLVKSAGGYLTLRSSVDDPRGCGTTPLPQSSLGTTLEWDRDSSVAASLMLYPRERFVTRVRGRLIQAVSVNSRNLGPSARLTYLSNTNADAAWMLGLKNPLPRADQYNRLDNESFNTDVQNVYIGGGYAGIHDFGGRQASSVLYQHPGQHGATLTANGDYHVDVFCRGVGATLRVMDKVAGRKTTICVPSWLQKGMDR